MLTRVFDYRIAIRVCHQEIVSGKAGSIAQLQHMLRLHVIPNQVEHKVIAGLTKVHKAV